MTERIKMPIAQSLQRRLAIRRMLDEKAQPKKYKDGTFKVARSYRYAKRRPEPARSYMHHDDKRSMHANVEALAQMMLDRMVIAATSTYEGNEPNSADAQDVFARHMIGRKTSFIGEAQIHYTSKMLEAGKLQSSYSEDAISRHIVNWFNKTIPLGACVKASMEHKDVVLKFEQVIT